MSVEYESLENILDRIRRLPPEYRLRLMQGILDTLIPATPPQSPRILQYGEYKDFDGPMSTFEDYAVAEWRPTEKELNDE